jgi:hypothetical protein
VTFLLRPQPATQVQSPEGGSPASFLLQAWQLLGEREGVLTLPSPPQLPFPARPHCVSH